MSNSDLKRLKNLLAIMKTAKEKDTLMCVWQSDIDIVEKAIKELLTTGYESH
jgi:hypothetical protein